MARRFHTLDVFTEETLAGNPLAVVLDCEGLDAARMQRIAREFNLSETVFVFAARPGQHRPDPDLHARPRTAVRRPSDRSATACLVARPRARTRSRAGPAHRARGGGRRRRLPRSPPRGRALAADSPAAASRAARPAAAVGGRDRRGDRARGRDIGFDGHEPSLFTAGAPFLFAPVRSLEAIGRARPGDAPWSADGGPATYLYTREAVEAGVDFHARMFAGGWGVPEDPATGSAAAAFAGVAPPSTVRPTAAHARHRAGLRNGPPEPHRPRLRDRGRGPAVGRDRRLGGDRVERRRSTCDGARADRRGRRGRFRRSSRADWAFARTRRATRSRPLGGAQPGEARPLQRPRAAARPARARPARRRRAQRSRAPISRPTTPSTSPGATSAGPRSEPRRKLLRHGGARGARTAPSSRRDGAPHAERAGGPISRPARPTRATCSTAGSTSTRARGESFSRRPGSRRGGGVAAGWTIVLDGASVACMKAVALAAPADEAKARNQRLPRPRPGGGTAPHACRAQPRRRRPRRARPPRSSRPISDPTRSS